MEDRKRIEVIDIIKGVMIIAMVGYHFLYDLVFFCGVPYKYFSNPVMDAVQFIICSVFILLSGASARISRSNARHGLRIGLGAVLISIVTYLFDPSSFVVFGILHFLAVAAFVYAAVNPFVSRIPNIVGYALWGVLFAVSYFLLPTRTEIPHLWLFGFTDSAFSSTDYFPILPWIFLYLFGAQLGKPLFERKFPSFFYRLRSKPLAWCGKQSFLIYMCHQPILMGIVFLVNSLDF